MNKELPNRLSFDSSKRNEMQEFLDFIYKITIQNNLYMSSDIIYNQLMYRNLSPSEKDEFGKGKYVKSLFDKWKLEFRNKRNINAFCDEVGWPYWFQFTNGDVYEEEYIKLYIPINLPHLYQGVTELFSFLAKEGIEHQSKVGSYQRIDNVIVRLRKNDTVSAQKIINFINSNKYLRSGLNKNNPFIPTINGIGYMVEKGYSYNTEISKLMSNYINNCKKENKRPNVDEFKQFIEARSKIKELPEIFNNAYSGQRPVENQKIQNQKQQPISKDRLLYNAVRETYMKYGIKQVQNALLQVITNNDYGWFTNNNQARQYLKAYVSKDDIIKIITSYIEKTVGSNNVEIPLVNRVYQFINLLYKREKSITIDDICRATLEKYGSNHLIGAINNYIYRGNANSFTRGNDPKQNLREMIIRIGPENLFNHIFKVVEEKGYRLASLEDSEIVTLYVNTLSSQKNKRFK